MPAIVSGCAADVDTLVVGAGVVGLAAARALAASGREVLVLEREPTFGSATSARNSEVVHAGIYYPKDSLKARLCVAGRRMLYDYCATRGVPHRRCGKLIVATSAAQRDALAGIAARAGANGVDDLGTLDGTALGQLEPAIAGVAALHSPSTGIVDSHALMLSLLGEAESGGAMLATRATLERVEREAGGLLRIEVGGEAPSTIRARELVNAAGHGACALAGAAFGGTRRRLPEPVLAKGSYFALRGPAPATRLIYPVPEPGGLGVHLTLDLAGRARFGPDVEWIDGSLAADDVDLAVDPARAARFGAEIRKYWPALPDGALVPDYAGLRPKLRVDGRIAEDFVIEGPATHGVPGWVDLLGVESPGLTASLAIAAHVVTLLDATGD